MKHVKLITKRPAVAQLQDLPTSQLLGLVVALISIVETFMFAKGAAVSEDPKGSDTEGG